MSFLQETRNWSMSCRRFETLAFHLDLTASDAAFALMWQSVSALGQKSRTYTGVKRTAAARAKTGTAWVGDILIFYSRRNVIMSI